MGGGEGCVSGVRRAHPPPAGLLLGEEEEVETVAEVIASRVGRVRGSAAAIRAADHGLAGSRLHLEFCPTGRWWGRGSGRPRGTALLVPGLGKGGREEEVKLLPRCPGCLPPAP